MSIDADEGDVAAMREQGDLHDYMRSLIHRRPSRPPAPPKTPGVPGYRPGVWPPGTGPPDRVDDGIPREAWAAALAEYRVWALAGCPDSPSPPCQCAACHRTRTTDPEESG